MRISLILSLVNLALFGGFLYVVLLLVRALRKYLRASEAGGETAAMKKSLGEAIKNRRTACRMTQEFVAESLGVSRQAVSKWENGSAEPSTSNLLALAKLFGIPAQELLREAE